MKNKKLEEHLKKLTNKIYDIENFEKSAMKCPDFTGTGIGSGYGAIILYLLQLEECDRPEGFEETLKEYILKFMKFFDYYNENLEIRESMLLGYSGVGLLLSSLSKLGVKSDNLKSEIDDKIVKATNEKVEKCLDNINNNEVDFSDYDVIQGLSSVLRYLIENNYNDKTSDLIGKIVHYFISLTEVKEADGSLIPNYFIKQDKIIAERIAEMYPHGVLDLGLAHGIAGILSVLSLAKINSINVDGLDQCIEGLLTQFKNCVVLEDSLLLWPGMYDIKDYVNGINYVSVKNYSWCYGVAGIARAIYLGAKAVSDIESEELAIESFKKLSKRIEDVTYPSSIICHGYSGLLLSYKLMYDDTKIEMFSETCDKLEDKISETLNDEYPFGFGGFYFNGVEEEYTPYTFNILDGSFGINVALSYYKNNKLDLLLKMLCLN